MGRFVATSIAAWMSLQAGCHASTPSTQPRGVVSTGGEPAVAHTAGEAPSHQSDAARTALLAGDHHRDTFSTARWTDPPSDVRAVVEAFEAAAREKGASGTGSAVLLDERLSLVAARLAVDASRSLEIDVRVEQLEAEVGSPYKVWTATRVASSAATPEWARAWAASYDDSAPLLLGAAPDPHRPGEVVVVLGRQHLKVVGQPRRDRARSLHVELGPTKAALTPRLMLLSAAGLERLDGKRSGNGWLFEREATFDGTIGAVLGYGPAVERESALDAHVWHLGVFRFGGEVALPGDGAKTLGEAVNELRRAWKRPPLRVDAAEGPPCGEVPTRIAGGLVTTGQSCFVWASEGSDAERWAAARHQPILFNKLEDARVDVVQFRRAERITSVRFARAFEELPLARARARAEAAIARRFPGAKRDPGPEAALASLAQRWGAVVAASADAAPIRAETATEAQKWAGDDRQYAMLLNRYAIDEIVQGVDPPVMPTAYALGLVRGTGVLGHPLYYGVIVLKLPPVR